MQVSVGAGRLTLSRLFIYILPILVCIVSLPTVAVASPQVGLNCMLVGGRILEVVGNRQLSLKADGLCSQVSVSPNGKYAALSSSDDMCLRVIEINSYRSVLTLDRSLYLDVLSGKSRLSAPVWTLFPTYTYKFVWLPDSKSFVILGTRLTPDEERGAKTEQFILKMNLKGEVLASNPIPEHGLIDQMETDPDGLRVAYKLYGPNMNSGPKNRIIVWDMGTGSSETVISSDGGSMELLGWNRSGDGLLYTNSETQMAKKAVEFSLVSKTEKLIDASRLRGYDSPDRAFTVEGPGLTVRSRSTGQIVRKVAVSGADLCRWLSNSKMFTYWTYTMVCDENKLRKSGLYQLWLTSLENNKMNHMCLAFNAGLGGSTWGSGPTWSSDLTRMGYTNEGQAYIAELKWRDPSLDEKVALGVALTEAEEKTILQHNALQIGLALAMYASDHDGAYPPADSVREELKPHMRDSGLLLRPGKDQDIFTYHPQTSEKDVAEPADTVIGTLDAGYSWVVNVYVDGHVKTVPKN